MLLDKLDPCGRMSLRLYRDSCNVLDGLFLKDLRQVGTDDLSRVVLVDNSPVSLLINPDNSILVSSFYTNPNDTALGDGSPPCLDFRLRCSRLMVSYRTADSSLCAAGQLLPILRRLHHAGDVSLPPPFFPASHPFGRAAES